MKSVKILPPEVARKIAAGEVIDRPNAIVRELLDNAIDSQAKTIVLEIAGGGIEKIRVTDDGCGMTKEDLVNSVKPHATSKISTEQDLLALNTMGFRGEALPSIAAVSRLEITSKTEDEKTAYKLECQLEGENLVSEAVLQQGTVVQSLALFENFPARRVFLKRPQSEGTLCKQTFIEKALAFPQISFRFINDGNIKLDLPATENPIQRCIQALELKEGENQFHCIKKADEVNKNWDFTLIVGNSSIIRNDRKNIHIFVNGRKITEYSLMQAIEYGVVGSFPNGTHPVACLFLNMNPALVDFNIHPAKKEARFKDLSSVHHAISSEARKTFTQENIEIMKPFSNQNSFDSQLAKEQNLFDLTSFEKSDFEHADFDRADYTQHADFSRADFSRSEFAPSSTAGSELNPRSTAAPRADFTARQDISRAGYARSPFNQYPQGQSTNQSEFKICEPVINYEKPNFQSKKNYNFKYIGSIFNVFLLVEKDDCLYAIDQHAGHERILFEELYETAGQIQPLLFPYEIEVESESQSEYLASIQEEMTKAGFVLEQQDSKWVITSVPIKWQGTKKDLQEAILEKHYSPSEFMRHFLATCACKAAIKEGHYIDPETACSLIEKIFALKDPHCPHGRPIWFTLTREQMYSLVKRT